MVFYFCINFVLKNIYINSNNSLNRAWIGFQNLSPISAAKKFLDKFYNKNQKFTRAEDEMRITLSNVVKGRRPIRQKDEQKIEKKDVSVKLIRLTPQQIFKAVNGDLSDFERKCINDNIKKRYNLRNRNSSITVIKSNI